MHNKEHKRETTQIGSTSAHERTPQGQDPWIDLRVQVVVAVYPVGLDSFRPRRDGTIPASWISSLHRAT
jgi:hypothetical protein